MYCLNCYIPVRFSWAVLKVIGFTKNAHGGAISELWTHLLFCLLNIG